MWKEVLAVSDTSIDFLYLSEQDVIDAGVTDIARCVDVMEETLILLRDGDFRMAGSTAMLHGAMISFPKKPEHENMPADGPDRRFMAMPAYLGGRFGTTGVKWYGSNIANREKGLPRSILMFQLNDTETGAPLSFMSASLLSAYRTGAIPGVAVKHLAREDATTMGVIGPGVIGRSVTQTTLSLRPSITRIGAKGLDDADVQRFADYITPRFPQVTEIVSAASYEEVARESDVLTVTVTTNGSGSSAYLFLKKEWIKPGALLLLPAAVRFDDDELIQSDARMVVDAWRLYDAWAEEYGVEAYERLGIVGTHWHDLMRAGRLAADRIEEIADIASGRRLGRTSADQIFLYSAGGMPVEDVAWATDVYRNAVKKGIGTKLNLWDKPALA
ncbi:tyramine oxidase subunit B [Corynebacterium cystitidis]|uniref:tyramine oxidase subunit B n=1 Tax=Corynebacterium cystitidis TaxID=35757 RepID=UPI00211F0075|nr:tyramine oxidase subunit B [Corynebacterium cystitidis]